MAKRVYRFCGEVPPVGGSDLASVSGLPAPGDGRLGPGIARPLCAARDLFQILA